MGPPPRNASLGSQVMAGLNVPGNGPDDGYRGPTAKTFQSNTIIPNKSTMVEDDDDETLSDVYGGRRDTTYTSRSVGAASDKGGHAAKEYEAQVGELQTKIQDLETRLHDKDSELDRLHETRNEIEDVCNGLGCILLILLTIALGSRCRAGNNGESTFRT